VISRATDWFVPPWVLDAGAESTRRARAIVGFGLVGIVIGLANAPVYWWTMPADVRPYVAGGIAGFSVVTIVELLVGRRFWHVHMGGFLLYVNVLVALTNVVWFTGGAESPGRWWYIVLPMIGLSGWSRAQSLASVSCGGALLVGWHFLDTAAHPIGHDLPDDVHHAMILSEQIGLFVSVAALSVAYEVSKNAALRQLARANLALEKARDDAVVASSVKSAFLANMSHEIRTPMTAILGFTDAALDRFEVGSEEWTWLDIVRRNGQHLLELINDILDLSRIEADKLEFEKIRFSPFALIAEVASLMRVRTEENGIELHVRFTTALPEVIETDPRRTRQILINLVGNAIKFTKAGSVTLRAGLVRRDGASRIEFAVADTGIGMTDAQRSALFVPFTQGDSSTSREFGGSGLGLAISQSLARKLGGAISAASTAGVGSIFSFSIPTGVGAEVPLVMQLDEAILDRGRPPAGKNPEGVDSCGDRRVLLAEDGRDNQILIALLLRRAGATVTVVDNGQAAVEHALEAVRDDRPYDVLLMDIQMPLLDGLAATRALRAHGYTQCIIALTASAMAGDRERALVAGCDDFLAKPIDKDVLLAAVAACGAEKLEISASGAT
jgi:signal transduction histidine kinase/ActR/RegA family two-component response regulator